MSDSRSELTSQTRDAVLTETRGTERWKYTNLKSFLEGSWELAESLEAEDLPSRTRFSQYEGEKAGEIVLLNGRFIPGWSQTSIDGVTIRQKPLTKPQASQAANTLAAQDKIASTFVSEILEVEIAAKTVLKKPIVITNYVIGGESLSVLTVASTQIEIKVEKLAEVAFVEYFNGEGRTLTVPVTSMQVAPGARVSHLRVNATRSEAAQLGMTRITQARDSFMETYQLSLSGRLTREDLEIRLMEPGAEALLDGLYIVDGKRHSDHATTVEHIAPQTLSSQLYKGILADDSRAVFNGRVRIHRDAQQSNAAQLNNNLLLSKRAEADAKPELEIDADDVKASHGATIGQLDPEHIFYLRARAIPEAQAKAMLARGFAQDVAFRIRNEFLREGAIRAVDKALQSLNLGQDSGGSHA